MERTVDNACEDNIVHIEIDHTHMQKHEQLRWLMLEQMITATYDDVNVTKHTNQYGLLTDMWIRFGNPDDAMHFRLSYT